MNAIVVDSGPLIALFDGSDRYHPAAVGFVRAVVAPLYTNIAVITEVVHLLDFEVRAQLDFLNWAMQALRIDSRTGHDLPRIYALIEKYADLPADFADASLIALCERLGTRRVARVDRDFTIYRDAGRRPFTNVFFAQE